MTWTYSIQCVQGKFIKNFKSSDCAGVCECVRACACVWAKERDCEWWMPQFGHMITIFMCNVCTMPLLQWQLLYFVNKSATKLPIDPNRAMYKLKCNEKTKAVETLKRTLCAFHIKWRQINRSTSYNNGWARCRFHELNKCQSCRDQWNKRTDGWWALSTYKRNEQIKHALTHIVTQQIMRMNLGGA